MKVFFDKCSDAIDFATASKSFGIYYSKHNTPNSNIHTHECFEILFCVSGGKNFLIDDKIYKVEPYDIYAINSYEAHKISFEDGTEVERYTLQIHPEFIFSSSTDKTDLSACFYHKNISNRISLSSENAKKLISHLRSLDTEYKFGDDVLKKSVMIQILTIINEYFYTCGSAISEQPQNTHIKKAISYINEHLSENLTLELIAKNSYISVNQLCRTFKTTLGTTVMKYIIGKRISQAKIYLKNGYSVFDTAFMCGFGDYSNFIRTFTQSVGISPGKYKSSSLL